jgi:hypothetical protein
MVALQSTSPLVSEGALCHVYQMVQRSYLCMQRISLSSACVVAASHLVDMLRLVRCARRRYVLLLKGYDYCDHYAGWLNGS